MYKRLGKSLDKDLEKRTAKNRKELDKLTEKASALRKSLVTSRASDDDISRFADLIEEHAGMEQMTVEIAHKLIDHIVVYEKDSVKGRSRNRIDVYYQFIGMIPERR